MAKITKKELERINELVNEFNMLKIKLGDTVITQNALLDDVAKLRATYQQEETKLVEKYGADATIDIQTGEIKKKD